jgi:hypothetical protein
VFLSWSAQAGKSLYLAIGRQGEAEFDLRGAKGVATVPGELTIYNAMPAGIGTYYATNVDWRNGRRICLYAVSTLDVACSIQAFGNKSDATTDIALIDVPTAIAIGSVTTQIASLTINGDDLWHPYIGVQIVTAAIPTAGTLLIRADIQE